MLQIRFRPEFVLSSIEELFGKNGENNKLYLFMNTTQERKK
jgi:hypothetical protein